MNAIPDNANRPARVQTLTVSFPEDAQVSFEVVIGGKKQKSRRRSDCGSVALDRTVRFPVSVPTGVGVEPLMTELPMEN